MSRLGTFAMTVAMAAAASPPGFAAVTSGGHAAAAYAGGFGRADRGPGAGGRSAFRDDGHPRFNGGAGDWSFAHADRDPGRWRGRGHRRGGWAYAYGGYPYDFAGYGGYGDWGAYGPQPPYGDSFAGPYGPVGRPMAPALAPMAYGPGAHDGAYAYGYNGYAQTPALPQMGPAGYWLAGPGARGCGC